MSAVRRRLIRLVTAAGFGAVGGTAAALLASSQADAATADAAYPAPGDRLKLVQVVFRHGARTPLSKKYWPELVDAWDVCGRLYEPVGLLVIDEDGGERPVNSHDAAQVATKFKGGCAKGELTREGQQQARSFGRWLRHRYVTELSFLPEDLHEAAALLYGRTTNYSRTVATLAGVLTGLLPGAAHPITVHTTEEMDEILFGNPASCQRLKTIVKTAVAAEEQPSPEVAAAQEAVRTALGLPAGEPVRWLDLHDTLMTMQTHGKVALVPEGLRDPALQAVVERLATARFMRYVVGGPEDPEVLRLGMGRLMALMLERMEAAAGGKNAASGGKDAASPRLLLYSGHDSTIMPLLAVLGREVDHWPSYLANLVFELWETPKGDHYVRVLYDKEPLRTRHGETYALKDLRHQVLGPYLITDKEREAECLVHFSHDSPAGQHVREVERGGKAVEVGSSVSED